MYTSTSSTNSCTTVESQCGQPVGTEPGNAGEASKEQRDMLAGPDATEAKFMDKPRSPESQKKNGEETWQDTASPGVDVKAEGTDGQERTEDTTIAAPGHTPLPAWNPGSLHRPPWEWMPPG